MQCISDAAYAYEYINMPRFIHRCYFRDGRTYRWTTSCTDGTGWNSCAWKFSSCRTRA